MNSSAFLLNLPLVYPWFIFRYIPAIVPGFTDQKFLNLERNANIVSSYETWKFLFKRLSTDFNPVILLSKGFAIELIKPKLLKLRNHNHFAKSFLLNLPCYKKLSKIAAYFITNIKIQYIVQTRAKPLLMYKQHKQIWSQLKDFQNLRPPNMLLKFWNVLSKNRGVMQ